MYKFPYILENTLQSISADGSSPLSVLLQAQTDGLTHSAVLRIPDAKPIFNFLNLIVNSSHLFKYYVFPVTSSSVTIGLPSSFI